MSGTPFIGTYMRRSGAPLCTDKKSAPAVYACGCAAGDAVSKF